MVNDQITIPFDPELAERIRNFGIDQLAKMIIEVQPMNQTTIDAVSFLMRRAYRQADNEGSDND